MGMGGERMVVKRSIASLVRKKLSDITNTQTQPKLHSQAEKPPETSAYDKNCIEQLLKERATLMQLLAERDKIIELNGAELLRLRANVQKLQLQNWNLAQSNSQMLAELNLGKEKMKALQHEILCKAALLQEKNSNVGGKEDMDYENDGSLSKEVVEKAGQPLLKACNDEKLCNRNRKRTKRSRCSFTASTKDANASKEKIEIRSQLRRQSASFKTHEYKPLKKSSSETESAKAPVSQTGPSLLTSRAKEDETGENRVFRNEAVRSSFGKPLRKTVEKVQPHKEIPLKVKLRRLE